MNIKNPFVKNPLSVIAIFAGFAEVSATAVLPMLQNENQFYFLFFVMGFPVLLIGLFFATLNWNHKVLYAPSDYSNEQNFMQLLVKATTIEQQEKMKIEVKSFSSTNQAGNHVGKVNTDEMERDALFSRSEDLVLRIIESDLGGNLERNVNIGGEKKMIYFDGVLVDNKRVTAVEVKLLRTPLIKIDLLDTIIQQAEKLNAIANDYYLDFRLILAVVHDFGEDEENKIYEDLAERLVESKIKSEIRLYEVKKLWKRYGIPPYKS